MSYRRYRRQSSFWQELIDYLRSELLEVLRILTVCMVVIFLVSSLFIGMYQMLRSAVLWLITN